MKSTGQKCYGKKLCAAKELLAFSFGVPLGIPLFSYTVLFASNQSCFAFLFSLFSSSMLSHFRSSSKPNRRMLNVLCRHRVHSYTLALVHRQKKNKWNRHTQTYAPIDTTVCRIVCTTKSQRVGALDVLFHRSVQCRFCFR